MFEAEQSSGIILWGCGRIMRIEIIYLLGNKPSSGSWRKESIAYAFCLLLTDPVSIHRNPSKRQWCQAPVSSTYTGVSCPRSLVPKLLQTHCRNCPVYLVQHYIAALKRWSCFLLILQPTISLPFTWGQQMAALRVSGGGQPLAVFFPFWCQRTSWWVCPISHETTECLYNYLPLVFINCYGNWTPVKGQY